MEGKQEIGGTPSLLDVFRSEAETQTVIIQEGLLAITTQNKSPQGLENIMRAAHALKGAAQLVEIDAASNLAQAIEDCSIATLNQKLDLTATQVDGLQCANLLLLNLSRAGDENLDRWLLEHQPELETTIQKIRSGFSGLEADFQDVPPVTQSPSHPVPTSPLGEAAPTTPQCQGQGYANSASQSPHPPVPLSPPLLSDPSMLELFRLEVESQVIVLNEGLLSLENQPQSAQALEALMRAAHSVKGAARIVSIEAAVQLAHVMEDCFVAAQKHTVILDADRVDVLFGGVDRLSAIGQLDPDDLNSWLTEHAPALAATRDEIAGILTPGAVTKVRVKIPPQEAEDRDPKNTEIAPISRQHDLESTLVTDRVPTLAPPGLASNTPSDRSSIARSPSTQLAPVTERVVRVNAENLNRIMSLAGESLIETNWLQPFADSLVLLRKRQLELSKILENMQNDRANDRTVQNGHKYLEVALNKEQECREILVERLSELELYARRTASLSDRLYREVIASNMRPFNDGVQGFPRMIRDLARKLGKQVVLNIRGKSTPVDRDILKKLEAPLTHILRNAVDHGLEMPEERLAVGKSSEGTLVLEASHRGGMLSIIISDDGKGISTEWLRQKIVSKNLTTAETAAQLSETELMEFLFLPGFSTAAQVTEISGRGVGLDIAKSMAQEVGGYVRASSQLGKGTSFNFQLPLTLSVVRTLLVEISGEPYAFSLARIEQIVIVEKTQIYSIEGRQYFTLNNRNIGLVSAHQVLELTEVPAKSDSLSVVVLSEQSDYYGLVVDRFFGEHDLVIRPLDPRLSRVQDVRNISAAALLGDGSLILIVDVSDLIRSIDSLLNNRRLSHFNSDANVGGSRVVEVNVCKNILVVDDSITVREMERRLLENKGYQVDIAVDGLEGWESVCTKHYDLVISDVDMPRMNGIELVGKIKNDPKLNAIPVIIVSYKDSQEHRLQGMEAGANYYLTKASFHDETLVNAVMDLIGN